MYKLHRQRSTYYQTVTRNCAMHRRNVHGLDQWIHNRPVHQQVHANLITEVTNNETTYVPKRISKDTPKMSGQSPHIIAHSTQFLGASTISMK